MLVFQLRAQQLQEFSFKHFSTTEGLVANDIRCSLQDAQGFIWIGTSDGLQRFDGTRFLSFRHSAGDPHSLPANAVIQLLLDKQKNLWVLLDNGKIGIFDTQHFIFKEASVVVPNKKSLGADKEMFYDLRGSIIYMLKGVTALIYNPGIHGFIPANPFIGLPQGWKVYGITADTLGKKYWICGDSGIAVFDPVTSRLNTYNHNPDHDPLIATYGKYDHTYYIFVDSKHRLWFEQWPTGSGSADLYCYDLKSHSTLLSRYNMSPELNQYHELRNLLEQKDGTIWIRGNQVFARFNEAKKKFELVHNGYDNEHSIAYEVVNHLYEDREQNLWASTSNNGIYLFNPHTQVFTVVQHLDWLRNTIGNGAVMSFAHTNDGTVLSGAWGNGLYRYDSAFHNIPLNIRGIADKNFYSVWSMFRSRDNRTIWMSMQPGIAVYDQVTNQARVYNPPILENRTVRQILEDKQGNLWIGVQNRGVYKWTKPRTAAGFNEAFVKIDSVPSTNINKIIEDSKGFIWACTHIDGIYKIDPLTNRVVDRLHDTGPPAKRLLDNMCLSVMEYNDSLMLIGAGGLNIYNTRRHTMEHLTVENGLPSDVISSMEKDSKGWVWMGMMNGLCRFDPARKSFTYYNRKDGFLNDNFVLAASYRMPDGKMLFGTNENFVVFDPLKITTASPPPDVRITDLKLLDHSLPVDSLLRLKRMELTYDQNSLLIQFAGLTYQNKDKISYYYMLEGLDKDWKKADGSNQASYSYLPARNYLFKVKIKTGDNIESSHITTLKIRIKPPFWRTWWFVSLLVLAALSLFLYMDRLRLQRIRATMRMRNKIATNFTKDMSSTLGTINVLSEMAKVKAAIDTERTKEYVTQISDNSSRMMEVMDDMIWSIRPENDSLEQVIEKMQHFAAELHVKYGVEIHFKLGEKVREIKLRMDQRHELYAIFKEAITNAARHAQTRYIDIGIDCHKSKLRLRIQDEGRGFDVEAVSYGRGLNDMQKKASSLQARLLIQSEINTGTIVQFEMPLGLHL